MKTNQIKDDILELLQKRAGTALTPRELAEALDLRGNGRKSLQKWLNQLVTAGRIVCIHRNRYTVGRTADLLTGALRLARSGDGFVTEEDGGTAFVGKQDVGTALPGDRVLVRLSPSEPQSRRRGRQPPAAHAGKLPVGKIIRIVQRIPHDLVGTLKSTGRFHYVTPIDAVYKHDFYVPEAPDARIGDRVLIHFTKWDNEKVNPEAEIREVLGPADEPSLDTLAIIRHYGLQEDFPEPTLREAESSAARLEQPGPRLDLTRLRVLTIDPRRARDFDDALSLETDDEGRRVLGVHIADVSHFVEEGSALDLEARRRGNSVYLADKVVPMLPEQLSNGVCSLQPDRDRLAFSVFITIDGAGRPLAARFAKSTIRSAARLTYEEAMEIIGAPASGVRLERDQGTVALLLELHALARQLRKLRFAHHALNLDVPELEIDLDDKGKVSGLHLVASDPSHQLVEECMIAANEAVAAELSERGLPLINRVHDAPSPERIEELTLTLAELGFTPGNLRQRRGLSRFLATIEDHPLGGAARVAVLRSMRRAVYATEPRGHFGLAKKHYAHFTSPIRRYPDLVVHRQLARALKGGRGKGYAREVLEAVAVQCTDTENTAEQAERDLVEIKKYRYLQSLLAQRKPPVYEAVVAKVVNFGMFVEVPDLQVRGLVHASAMSDRFVRFSHASKTLRAGRKVYRIGDRVPVTPVKVDYEKRQIDFAPAAIAVQGRSG